MAFMWKTSILAIEDPAFSAPVIGGFLVALAITRSHLVGVIAAAVVGFVGVVITAGMPDASGSMALPQFAVPAFDFDPASMLALGLPLLILTVGVGNLQSLAVLRSEGFQARGFYGLAAGVASLINALGGGHAAAIGGSTTVIASGPSAGPKESRFLVDSAVVRTQNGRRGGGCSSNSGGAGPSLVVHPHCGGIGADSGFQSIGKENCQRSDAVWSYNSIRRRRTALASRRITHGFLGAGGRGCGGQCIGVRATVAGLAAKRCRRVAGLTPDLPLCDAGGLDRAYKSCASATTAT